MRISSLAIILMLAGCAPTTGYYIFADGYQDTWTAGCPQLLDCEDVALCKVEQARRTGKDWKLYRVEWFSGTPWAHLLAGDGKTFTDQHGERLGLPERGRLTHICRQLTPHGASARGTWLCLPQAEGEHVFKKEVE
jgi:hypothetical protein